jgi:hypothetical protein
MASELLALRARVARQKKVRGRPKVGGERPWEAAGLSRRTWYRRQAEEEASDERAADAD